VAYIVFALKYIKVMACKNVNSVFKNEKPLLPVFQPDSVIMDLL